MPSVTDPTRPPEHPAAHDHVVPEGPVVRVVRWLAVALGAYNAGTALIDGAWLRGAVWTVVLAVLLLGGAVRRRTGTRVEADGLRVGRGLRWGPLVRWEDVVAVRVAGPYDPGSRAELRDGGVVPLRGMSVEAVRELAREHGLDADDRAAERARRLVGDAVDPDPAVEPAADDAMDGPFRSSRRRAGPPAG